MSEVCVVGMFVLTALPLTNNVRLWTPWAENVNCTGLFTVAPSLGLWMVTRGAGPCSTGGSGPDGSGPEGSGREGSRGEGSGPEDSGRVWVFSGCVCRSGVDVPSKKRRESVVPPSRSTIVISLSLGETFRVEQPEESWSNKATKRNAKKVLKRDITTSSSFLTILIGL